MLDKNELASLKDIVKDLTTTPDFDYANKLTKRLEFTQAEQREMRSIMDILSKDERISDSTKAMLLTESWRVNFIAKPPSIDEFLSSSWIGATSDSLFPYIKKIMTEFFDPNSINRDLILYCPIGIGKSLATTLIALYVSVHLYLMRDMYKLFNLANSTIICIMFVSYSLDKVKDLLIEPFKQIMLASDRFHKCRTLEQMENIRKEPYDGTIHWSTSGDTNILTMAGTKDKVNLKVTSNPAGLLGLTIILGLMTELTFFRDRGFTDDYIFRVYTDMKERVFSRFANFLDNNPSKQAYDEYVASTSYYARTVLDSSPNTLESILDRHIVNEAPTRKGVYLVKGTKWDFQPWLFKSLDEKFPVFIGSASKKPKIIGFSEIDAYDNKDIIMVPEDLRNIFEDSVSRGLKNYAGIPSDGDEKLIQNKDSLEDIFRTSLKNTYTYIHAPEDLAPEGLIFEQVKKDFFIRVAENSYEFYRNPNAERFISIDQSLNSDFTGISMCHVEKDFEGKTVYIMDFTICIVPTKVKINLDAIKFFIHDLKRYGKLNILKVSFDIFQSESSIQYLKRAGFDVEHLSVDSSMSPYLSFISYMTQKRVKVGKNIILKNNFKSLIQSETEKGRPRIDHLKGKINTSLDNLNWDTSLLGYFMKDLSDSMVASIELATIYANKNITYVYDPREETQEYRVIQKDKLINGIKEKYGYSLIKMKD